jgi:hypothetical protein
MRLRIVGLHFVRKVKTYLEFEGELWMGSRAKRISICSIE